MVLYSKFSYGSQFSGEKNNLKIQYLVAEILSKNMLVTKFIKTARQHKSSNNYIPTKKFLESLKYNHKNVIYIQASMHLDCKTLKIKILGKVSL